MHKELFNPDLQQYLGTGILDFSSIPASRFQLLDTLSTYIRDHQGSKTELIFICTHNSRRSHLSQIWAQVAAAYYELKDIRTYSGGTEATAFNERAVAAMKRAGFLVEGDHSQNPHYKVTFSFSFPTLQCFSKTFDHPSNPQHDFAAVMTCSDAEDACPFVPGASTRISLHYEDPKAYDGTSQEAEKYDERCRQIATEMFYVMSSVARDFR